MAISSKPKSDCPPYPAGRGRTSTLTAGSNYSGGHRGLRSHRQAGLRRRPRRDRPPALFAEHHGRPGPEAGILPRPPRAARESRKERASTSSSGGSRPRPKSFSATTGSRAFPASTTSSPRGPGRRTSAARSTASWGISSTGNMPPRSKVPSSSWRGKAASGSTGADVPVTVRKTDRGGGGGRPGPVRDRERRRAADLPDVRLGMEFLYAPGRDRPPGRRRRALCPGACRSGPRERTRSGASPLRTLSQSEKDYDIIHQGFCLLPVRRIRLAGGEGTAFDIELAEKNAR